MRAWFQTTMVTAWVAAGLLAACGEEGATRGPEVAPVDPAAARRVQARWLVDEAEQKLARGDIEGAIVAAERATDLAGEDPAAWVTLAAAQHMAGRARDAVRSANTAIRIDGSTVAVWVTKAAALQALGELALAVEAAERAVDIAPDHVVALRSLGQLYGEQEAWEKQAEILDRRVALDDGDLEARMMRAHNWLAREHRPAAEAEAKEIVARDPRHLPAQVLLAAMAYQQQAYATALERAKIVLTIAPGHEAAQGILEASFYVLAAADLRCRHGERPWSDAQVAAVLERFREQGLSGVEMFHALDGTFRDDADAQSRVRRAMKDACPDGE